jgi:holo-[acyl-carrier protein] synthase
MGSGRAAGDPARRVVSRRREWQAGGVIVGIGVDVVDIARLRSALRRTPSLASRLFTDGERGRGPASLAACFAAKEATAKALGVPAGLRWADAEVTYDGTGRPLLVVSGTVAEAAARCGVLRWHLSITHDGGLSVAMVVAEG